MQGIDISEDEVRLISHFLVLHALWKEISHQILQLRETRCLLQSSLHLQILWDYSSEQEEQDEWGRSNHNLSFHELQSRRSEVHEPQLGCVWRYCGGWQIESGADVTNAMSSVSSSWGGMFIELLSHDLLILDQRIHWEGNKAERNEDRENWQCHETRAGKGFREAMGWNQGTAWA